MKRSLGWHLGSTQSDRKAGQGDATVVPLMEVRKEGDDRGRDDEYEKIQRS